jgi:hypothetical protein
VRIIVYHASYGCESGCCGHIIQLTDGVRFESEFDFCHPYTSEDGFKEFAEKMVREKYGEEHVKDLAWDECEIRED